MQSNSLHSLLEGALLGLSLALLIGPTFFLIIQTSMNLGVKAALWLVTGVILADCLIICLSYFGLSSVVLEGGYKQIIGVVGGVFLVSFGGISIVKPYKKKVGRKINSLAQSLIVLKGFTINLFNPFVLLFWMVSMGALTSGNDRYQDHQQVLIFFASTLLVVVSTDVIKAFLARRLARLLNETKIQWMNRISGVLLVIFGVVLAVKSLHS